AGSELPQVCGHRKVEQRELRSRRGGTSLVGRRGFQLRARQDRQLHVPSFWSRIDTACRWPASLPSRPHRPELGTATLPGRAGWRGTTDLANRRPTLDASAPPKGSALDPKYAAVQLNVKLFLKPGSSPAFEAEAASRRARMS